jgi:hypothetical protein
LQKTPSLHAVPLSVVHVPGLVPLHVWQSVVTPPPQELVQHTESTQVSASGFWLHIALRLHEPPAPCTAAQVPELQKKSDGQSVSTAQTPWQAVFAALHGVVAPHASGVCGGQTPALHVTAGVACALGIVPVHVGATPHDVPFATGEWHTPARHVSSVQTLPSLPHPVPSATFECVHPVAGLQPSVVHALPSLQPSGGPAVQTPVWQVSPLVQALPSSHPVPFATFCAAQPPGSLQMPV